MSSENPDSPDATASDARVIRRVKTIAVVLVLVLAVGAGRTLWSRASNAKALEAGTTEQSRTYVKVTSPTVGGGGTNNIQLPGTLQGQTQSPVASRAAGYVKRWTKDIGARVAKGELLAEIESPDVDQQLSQAMATREQVAASLALTRRTVARSEELRKSGMVSQQLLDEHRSAVSVAQANLNAGEANVTRLREAQAFKRVVAPFAGIITKRNVDVGDLIDGGAARPLFVLSTTDPLRVYVDVPQSSAQLVRVGQKVTITQNEVKGRTFEGQVVRTSGAIDPSTRTMQIEVALPNKDGALLPGAYVQVALPLAANNATIVSTNALLFRSQGVQVASVDGGGKVKLLPVKLGRNFGQTVEVIDGLSGTEKLVMNASDSLADGDTVTVAK